MKGGTHPVHCCIFTFLSCCVSHPYIFHYLQVEKQYAIWRWSTVIGQQTKGLFCQASWEIFMRSNLLNLHTAYISPRLDEETWIKQQQDKGCLTWHLQKLGWQHRLEAVITIYSLLDFIVIVIEGFFFFFCKHWLITPVLANTLNLNITERLGKVGI